MGFPRAQVKLIEVQARVRLLARRIDAETEVPVLYHYLSRLQVGDTYLEIGTWMGYSAVVAALSTPPGVTVWTVDSGEYHQAHWKHTPNEYLAILRRTFTQYGVVDRISISLAGSLGLEWDGLIQLLFIDGDHSPPAVKADVEKWSPFVPPGGVILFHDYTLYAGAKRAADRLLQDPAWIGAPADGSIRALRRMA